MTLPVRISSILILMFLFTVSVGCVAQEISFKDSIALYNKQRIKINKTGAEIKLGWGIANIAAGSAGYFGAQEGTGKYFSEMNGIFGVLNIGLATTGLLMERQQMTRKMSNQQAYDWYRTDKKIYLISAGVDVVFIGAGLGLASYGQSAKSSADVYKGLGASMALQGVFLLLFNNVMLLEHGRNGYKWSRIMDELRVTNNGIGFVHTFK